MEGIQILVDKGYLAPINRCFKIIIAHSDFLDTFPHYIVLCVALKTTALIPNRFVTLTTLQHGSSSQELVSIIQGY